MRGAGVAILIALVLIVGLRYWPQQPAAATVAATGSLRAPNTATEAEPHRSSALRSVRGTGAMQRSAPAEATHPTVESQSRQPTAARAAAAAPKPAAKPASELFEPLVADDPNQVFASATVSYHA